MYVYVGVFGIGSSQKRATGPLELQLQMVGNHYVSTGDSGLSPLLAAKTSPPACKQVKASGGAWESQSLALSSGCFGTLLQQHPSNSPAPNASWTLRLSHWPSSETWGEKS